MLAAAEFIEYAPQSEAVFSVPYGEYAVCRKFLESIDFAFDEEKFSETVSLRGRLRRDDKPLLEKFLRDLSGGGIVCTFRDV